ncbi:lipid A biosynthesis lauroyltransferase [Arenicella chitinivorans]|uniref:Lipid A biosynthesis lauroyltransferase n=1 Tax=Arenicella chitinivorans TaxID=1329800 RepID=A0A918S200_9GAMM|nr:lipid A biosynthesis lauroyltransferase [Arenicella chitinivorans]
MAPKYWPTWLGLLVLRGFSVLPLPILAVLGQTIGLLFYALGASRRRIAFKNIRVSFPEKSVCECRQINRRHFMLIGQSVFATPMHWWASKRRFNKLITVYGRAHYDAALASGNNIIILAPHFISLDVAGLRLAQERPMLTMYQYAKNGLIDEVVKRRRLRFGGELVERKAPLRQLIRAIRKGNPFYYLPDQDAGRKGIFVPFFHTQASTYPMLGKFAEMTNALVIPCRTRIKPWGMGYEVTLGKPLENFPSGDEVSDTARMNNEVAELIRPHPEQYFWVHKRFKTRPPEEAAKGIKFYQ